MDPFSITDRAASLVEAFRRPEYTGANRCRPCTAVNVGIAALISIGVGAFSLAGGIAVAFLGGAAIYLRGYLVPGTPTLTKRYFPDWFLGYFDAVHHPIDIDDVSDLDGEDLLLRTGAIVEDEAADDLVLDPEFETAWRTRIDALDSVDAAAADLAAMIGIDDDTFTVEWNGDAFVAWEDGHQLGQWESQGAFLADVAAAKELDMRYGGWDDLSIARRSQTLGLLRLFLDWCPTCDGTVALGQDVVESCCRSVDVVAATCQDCGDRLFEAPYDPERLSVGRLPQGRTASGGWPES